MSCSICGAEGHNAKTCSRKDEVMPVNGSDTHVLWVRFDKVSSKEANELLKAIIDAKEEVAPNARGSFAKGTKSEMPKKIAEALRLSEQSYDEQQKKIK